MRRNFGIVVDRWRIATRSKSCGDGRDHLSATNKISDPLLKPPEKAEPDDYLSVVTDPKQAPNGG